MRRYVMSGNRYWLSSGFFTMLHRGVDFFLGFVGFMMLVRIFTPDEFGVWVLLITIVAIIEMARNGFLQNGMIKFMVNQDAKEQARVQMASLWLNILLTAILMLLLWLGAPYLERWLNAPSLSQIIRIYVYILPVLVIHTHNLVLMQANYDFRAYFWAGISKSLPLFLVILYYYLSPEPLNLYSLAWYQNACFLLATVMSVYQVRKQVRFAFGKNGTWVERIFHFGKYVFGTNLVSMLTNSMDKFLLGALLSPIQVAMANTAGRVMNMVEIPVNSIASISYPKASEAFEKKDLEGIGKMYEKTLGMMLSLTVPFFILNIFFAELIIYFIAGNEYMDAAPFLRIVALIALIKPFDRQSGVFLDAIGRPAINMVMVFGTFLYGAVLSWVFIQQFGLLGAAFGLVTAVLITAIIKQVFLARFIPFRLLGAFSQAWHNYPILTRMALDKLNGIRG
ncbi:oligosaccharide flippase family protein [Pleomorphovibrio marinus]|uniref:oligosaccharide flippase family protein n=1 Tax=Pleomorphovibrio marinus TaxID=2164132 RepID=UPI001E55928C|nr:oligosaccharide flippase family protein [Pleomorphovibrio marinus]